ncbi:MAG: hypothetical protein IPO62_04595 [Saprospiraceae bacterium]|nr:hypothetical protein [Saprospiraceae bacterium]
MKNILQTLVIPIFLLVNSFTVFGQEEISLYNSKGKAIAYIATESGLIIYMWNGKPVAYLTKSGDDFNIYGFNGNHLGWYKDGIIYDHKGDAVGFIKGAINVYTEYEPYKSFKEFKPYAAYKEYAPYKPYFSKSFSSTPLSIFLLGGI